MRRQLSSRRGRGNVGNPEGISKVCGNGGKTASWLSMLSILCHFHGLPFARPKLDKLRRHPAQCAALATKCLSLSVVNERTTSPILQKGLRLSDSRSLEFRAEAFNVFNHAQFYGPAAVDGQRGDPSVGRSKARRRLALYNSQQNSHSKCFPSKETHGSTCEDDTS